MLDGRDVSILVAGMLFGQAWMAAQILQASGCSVRLVNLRMLQPVDREAIRRAALETRLLVTLEDHFLTGGLFSIVSELLALNRIAVDVMPLGLAARWFTPALLDDVLTHEGFTAQRIAEAVLAKLNS